MYKQLRKVNITYNFKQHTVTYILENENVLQDGKGYNCYKRLQRNIEKMGYI